MEQIIETGGPAVTAEDRIKIGNEPALLGPDAIRLIAAEVAPSEIAKTIKEMMGACLVSGSLVKKALEEGLDAPPDWRAREAGVKLWLSYVVGMPVQRQHIVQERRQSAPIEDLLGSPAAREALAKAFAGSPEGRAAMQEALGAIDV